MYNHKGIFGIIRAILPWKVGEKGENTPTFGYDSLRGKWEESGEILPLSVEG